jgi:hypothetical protein
MALHKSTKPSPGHHSPSDKMKKPKKTWVHVSMWTIFGTASGTAFVRILPQIVSL